MKHRKISNYNMNHFYSSDWRDIRQLFEDFDDALKDFDLELVRGDNVDDSHWFKIEKRRG